MMDSKIKNLLNQIHKALVNESAIEFVCQIGIVKYDPHEKVSSHKYLFNDLLPSYIHPNIGKIREIFNQIKEEYNK